MRLNNPLTPFFPVEERPDGVYIKVTRSERDSIQTEDIIRAVTGSGVMNFDSVKLKDIFSRARGVFERVGPEFEYYDGDFDSYITLNADDERASIKISEELYKKGKKPSSDQVRYFLKKNGVVHGINENLLFKVLSEEKCNAFVEVARSTPPTKGRDAKLDLKVSVSPEIKPKVKNDGSVDYRNIQTFTSVAKDDVLAEKIPPLLGTPGTTVKGAEIPPLLGDDLTMPAGRNTILSEDGTKLIAGVTGILYYEGLLLTVGELLHIAGDVDFSVGNIKYTGKVLINGDVRPGFSVEAEGSIEVKGGVESANIISRAGQVTIEKGIMGKDETEISAKQGISICFAQNTTLRTDGALIVEKYLLHCDVECKSFEAQGPKSSIIGGIIKAEKTIIVPECGSEKGIPTKVAIFDKNKLIVSRKVKELEALQDKLKKELEKIEHQLKSKAQIIKQLASQVSARQQSEVKKWVDSYNAMKKKVAFVESKLVEMEAALTKPGDRSGSIQVTGNCYPGTVVTLYDVSLPVDHLQTNKRFSNKDNELIIEG